MAVKKKKTKKNTKKIALKYSFWAMLVLVLPITLFYFLVFIGIFGKLPNKNDLKQIKNSEASEVITADRKMIGRYYYENRTNANIEELPQHLIDALVATEDARFFSHKGIDFRSLGRVLIKNFLLFNQNAGGGSTITQQLAKNVYHRKNHGALSMPVAKAKEITIARRMEKVYSKKEILELYLNTVPFGENTFGIETASIVFFNKKPEKLTLEESATLVGLLKANYTYNPRLHKKASLKRRNIVLGQMCKYGYLNQTQCDSVQNIELLIRYNPIKHDEGLAPYFREFVRHETLKILKDVKKDDGTDYNLYADGLRIYTTLESKMQRYAEEAVNQQMFSLQKQFDAHWKGREPWKSNPDLAKNQLEQSNAYKKLKKRGLSEKQIQEKLKEKHTAKVFTLSGEQERNISSLDSILHHFRYLHNGFLVINSHSGEILAWVGGIGYKYFKYDHVLAKRQVGSTFKPVVYATAIEHGTTPCDFYANDSIVFEQYNNWNPANADGEYGGYYSVKGGLANSVNTISVSLLMEQGIQKVIQMARKMGIKSKIPEVPSIALGTAELSLYEMVYAYSTFANKGKAVKPLYIRRIEDQFGKVVYENGIEFSNEQAFSDTTAQTMLAMMQQVVENGTAQGMRTTFGVQGEIAGKTGTTNNNTDGWFIGVTPVFIMGSWVGGDHQSVRFRSTYLGQGAHTAMPVCARFLNKVYTDPFYRSLPRASFNIHPSIYAQLNCADYKEELEAPLIEDFWEAPGKSIKEMIRGIFRKKNKGNE